MVSANPITPSLDTLNDSPPHNYGVSEYAQVVAAMTNEQKMGLFVALLKDLRQVDGGDYPIPLTTLEGEDLGTLLPPGWPTMYLKQNGPAFVALPQSPNRCVRCSPRR
jgi:hypothetical protein